MNFENRFLYLFLLFCWVNVLAQKKSDFFSSVDTSIEKLYRNPDECLSFTQSLLINEQRPENKIILQNIMAQAYAMKGDFVQSIRSSLDKDNQDLSQDNNREFSSFYLDYALAEQYQNLGLYKQSERLIDNINKTQQNVIPHIHFEITKAKIDQLHAINLRVLGKSQASLDYFEKSNKSLNEKSFENDAIKIENLLFSSSVFLGENNLDKAESQLTKAELLLKNHPTSSYLQALAFERKARLSFRNKNYNQSIEDLKQALAQIENVDYLPFKSRLYELLSKSYLANKNEIDYHVYNKLFFTSKTKLDASDKEGIRYLLKLTESFENKNLEINQFHKQKTLILTLIITGILSLAAFLYYVFENKRNKDLAKQLDFFMKQKEMEFQKIKIARRNIYNDSLIPNLPKEASPEILEISPKKTNIISKEKEEEILKKLENFEVSDRFLNKDMSLAVLAGQLDTNTKYLSEVINKYKGKNFNHYINELRINHIAYILKTNPTFLNYKVSYLADVSGFSSHSSFATVFKNITGMSPQTYIQQIVKTKEL